MIPTRIEGQTAVLGAPPDWVDNGEKCLGLPVRAVQTEQGIFLVSAWKPDAEELAALNRGDPVKLWIRTLQHPVVCMTVGDMT